MPEDIIFHETGENSAKRGTGSQMNNFDDMWDFCVMQNVDFPHCNRVHPLMQRRTQILLEEWKKDPNILKIVLFGSALEFRCSSFSDLDVYVEKKDPELPVSEPDLGCELDILCNLDHSSRLYKEIEKKGLLLYERNS